ALLPYTTLFRSPPEPVRPCGVPNSTRSAPAAARRSVCSTTWLGVPARQNRSSRSSLSSPPASSARPSASSARNRTSSSSSTCTVGSRRATTSTYMATSRRASARARSPSSSTTVTAPAHTRTAAVPRPAAVADVSTQVRICWTMSGLADPPIFTSSAICPASAAPRGPQTPSSTSTSGRHPPGCVPPACGRASRLPPGAHLLDHVRVGGPADLHLVGDLPGQCRPARSPDAEQHVHLRPHRRVLQAEAGFDGVHPPLVAAVVPRDQPAHDLHSVFQVRKRSVLGGADLLQPGAARQTEVSAPAAGLVEHRVLSGDLGRVQQVGVQAGG